MQDYVWQSTDTGLPAEGAAPAAPGRWRSRYLGLVAGLGAMVMVAHLWAGSSPLPADIMRAGELLAAAAAAAVFLPVWSAEDADLSRRWLVLGCAWLVAALLGAAAGPLGGLLGPGDSASLPTVVRGLALLGLSAVALGPERTGAAAGERWGWLLASLTTALALQALLWLEGPSRWLPTVGEALLVGQGALMVIFGNRALSATGSAAGDYRLLQVATLLFFAECCFLAPADAAPGLLGHGLRAMAALLLCRTAVGECLNRPLARARRSEARLRQLLDAVPDSLLIVDARGRIAAANRRTEVLFNCRRDQLLGRPVEILIPPELRAAHQGHRTAYGAAPRPREMGSGVELVAARLDGTVFPAEVSLSPMAADGQSWTLCAIRDITRRQEAERDLRQREQELRLLMESSPDLVLLVGRDRRLHYANAAVTRLTGRPPGHSLGASLEQLFAGADGQRLADRLAATFDSGAGTSLELPGGSADKPWQYLIRMVPELDEAGQVECVIVVATDVSDLTRAREESTRLAAILEAVPDLVSITTAAGELAYLNPAGRKLLAEAMSDGADDLFRSHCHPQWASRRLLEEALPAALRAGVWRGESAILLRNGNELPVMQTILPHRAEDGRVAYWSSIIQDFSERKQLEEQLLHLATHDVLTGLPNRALLLDRLRQAVHHGRRARTRVAVLFLDLDDFKTINDTLGHQCGDSLLEQVAQRLGSGRRAGDTVGRLGGDEFALILEGIGEVADVALVAEKLQAGLRRPYELQGRPVNISSSIGITLCPDDDEEPLALLRKADIAMYQAKQTGRAGFMFYRAEMDSHMQERLELREDLRRAVAGGELRLEYQPKVNLASGRICGMEALVRWQHPQRGLIPPAVFIPIAEATDLIQALDLWVLAAACRQNRAWQVEGLPPLRVAVNLSARQFADGQLVAHVARVLDETGLAAEYLELEITESMVMERPEQSLQTLHALKALGVHLSIDDFGTGYSSLSYLRSFPVNTIKVDRSFVRDAPADANAAAIASAIISMAHRLGLGVVAEGVESREHVEFLRHHRCDEIQGYFISHPLPPAEFIRFLRPAPGQALPVVRGAAWASPPTALRQERPPLTRIFPED